jgi:hypothetical protein
VGVGVGQCGLVWMGAGGVVGGEGGVVVYWCSGIVVSWCSGCHLLVANQLFELVRSHCFWNL